MPDSSDGTTRRRGPGRPFQPGQSGNPGGRPKSDVARLIREKTGDGETLVEFLLAVKDNDKEVLKGEAKMQERVRATELLLERGWGKAAQPMEHSGAEGQALSVTIDLGAGK